MMKSVDEDLELEHWAQTIRSLWAAFSRGQFLEVLEGVHPEVELNDPPGMSAATWYRGYEGAARWTANLLEAFADLQVRPTDFTRVDETRLLVRTEVSATGKRGGVPFSGSMTALVTMRDGLCLRMELREAAWRGSMSAP
jgi:ketosteroid isomerase-like protein